MKISQKPSLKYEKRLWRRGFKYVAGVDEVGRGCFAGPVVAGAVIFTPQDTKDLRLKTKDINIRVDDSKKLTSLQRERANEWIKENAITWGVGETSVATINRLGITKATKKAFRKAVSEAKRRLKKRIDFLLVDAFFIPYIPNLPTLRKKDKKGRFNKNPKGRQLAIKNGDEKSFSIAAASIVAKVYRDNLMISLSKKYKYKNYGWEKNKGYGTRLHCEAIFKYGMTGYHRTQFIQTYLNHQ